MAIALDFSRLQADIQRYVELAQQEAAIVAENAAAFLYQRTVERARQDENWTHLADDIKVWSRDGHLVIGFQDQELASQAFALEFGDEHTPPSPLFRTMGPDQSAAHDFLGGGVEFGAGSMESD